MKWMEVFSGIDFRDQLHGMSVSIHESRNKPSCIFWKKWYVIRPPYGIRPTRQQYVANNWRPLHVRKTSTTPGDYAVNQTTVCVVTDGLCMSESATQLPSNTWPTIQQHANASLEDAWRPVLTVKTMEICNLAAGGFIHQPVMPPVRTVIPSPQQCQPYNSFDDQNYGSRQPTVYYNHTSTQDERVTVYMNTLA